jgi:hypothetical protein
MWVAHTQWYHRPLSSHEPPDYPSTLSLPEEEQHGDPSRPPNPINAAHTPQVPTTHSKDVVGSAPPVDKSEALFSMCLVRSDQDDKKTAERWKGECDAILTFVSHSFQPCLRVPLLWLTPVSRQVFSRLLLRFLYPFPSRAFSRVHRTPQHSTSGIFIIYSPIPLTPSPSSIPAHLIHLKFLRRHPQS